MNTLKNIVILIAGACILLAGMWIGYKVGHAVGYVKGKVSRIIKPLDENGGWWPWRPRRPDSPSPAPPDDQGSPAPDRGQIAADSSVGALVQDSEVMDIRLYQDVEKVPLTDAIDLLESWVFEGFESIAADAAE